MAEKYLKLIQNGNTTFIPDNQRNRSFWAKQNSLVARSRSAHVETVTIIPATDEEVSFMQHSDVGSVIKQTASILPDNTAIFEMMNRLQRQNEEQALKISQLEAKQNAPIAPDNQMRTFTEVIVDTGEGIEQARNKPGPKPKDK